MGLPATATERVSLLKQLSTLKAGFDWLEEAHRIVREARS
jgi:hypothetical protein